MGATRIIKRNATRDVRRGQAADTAFAREWNRISQYETLHLAAWARSWVSMWGGIGARYAFDLEKCRRAA